MKKFGCKGVCSFTWFEMCVEVSKLTQCLNADFINQQICVYRRRLSNIVVFQLQLAFLKSGVTVAPSICD